MRKRYIIRVNYYVKRQQRHGYMLNKVCILLLVNISGRVSMTLGIGLKNKAFQYTFASPFE